ncbi:MAG: hypothetical protein IJ979_04165 [Tidjanibacter sp.]|nr:hypothetical protein [Tidjanibacter sp.]MBR4038169.1 hypothetical protein [Tidjanibacter sp.]
MKQVVRIAVFALVALLVCNNSMAQYAYMPMGENPFQTEIEQGSDPIELTKGQKWTDVGKSVLFTGLGLALAGVAHDAYIGFMGVEEEDEYMYGGGLPLFTGGGIYAAAVVGAASIPFFIAGMVNSRRDGGEPFVMSDKERGFTGIVEVGYGMPYALNMDAVYGYNLTNHIFVGAGAGFHAVEGKFMAIGGMRPSVAAYANTRLTLGNKRVAPYFSGSYGFDFGYRKPFVSFEFGSRIRRVNSEEKGPLWIGVKSKLAGFNTTGFALKCGWSF